MDQKFSNMYVYTHGSKGYTYIYYICNRTFLLTPIPKPPYKFLLDVYKGEWMVYGYGVYQKICRVIPHPIQKNEGPISKNKKVRLKNLSKIGQFGQFVRDPSTIEWNLIDCTCITHHD